MGYFVSTQSGCNQKYNLQQANICSRQYSYMLSAAINTSFCCIQVNCSYLAEVWAAV